MSLTQQESDAMKGALATIDTHIATADNALHAAMTASDTLDGLIDDATGTTPPPPTGPVASFTYAPPTDPQFPRSMIFTGLPLGMVSYRWDFGNGVVETGTSNTNKYSYPTDGTYTVTLTVTDAAGLTGTSSQSVVVALGSNGGGGGGGTTPPPTGTDVRAELPRVHVDTTFPDQTGTGIHVPIGGNLHAALARAKPGDTITLANGGTWTGNHFLSHVGSDPGWIVIRPDNMSGVPPQGTRITPAMAQAAGLPKLLAPDNQGALMTDAGAHHYRIVGIEVAPTPGVYNGGLCRMGSGSETKVADLPHHLVYDRVYVHGIYGQSARRGIVLNCGEAAVIDSTVDEFAELGADSQAITGWTCTGPFLIENNRLDAASENIIFGGADPSIAGVMATDVVIRRNYFSKNMLWKGGGWNVKNLLEMKAAIRCLMEANVLEFCWADAQSGGGINLKSVNQGGSCPSCGCEDLTFRLNVVHHIGSGFSLSGIDSGATRIMTRTTLEHNVLFGMDLSPDYSGSGQGFAINNKPHDLLIAHNSVFGCSNQAITFGGPMSTPPTGLRIRDNIIDAGQYGIKGPGLGTKDVLAMIPGLFMSGNVIVGPGSQPVSEYPAGNYVAPNRAAVGFAADYSLLPSSPYKGKGTDGKDPGADIAAVKAAIVGVMGPAPQIGNFVPG